MTILIIRSSPNEMKYGAVEGDADQYGHHDDDTDDGLRLGA